MVDPGVQKTTRSSGSIAGDSSPINPTVSLRTGSSDARDVAAACDWQLQQVVIVGCPHG